MLTLAAERPAVQLPRAHRIEKLQNTNDLAREAAGRNGLLGQTFLAVVTPCHLSSSRIPS
jgi:hypothetical protein